MSAEYTVPAFLESRHGASSPQGTLVLSPSMKVLYGTPSALAWLEWYRPHIQELCDRLLQTLQARQSSIVMPALLVKTSAITDVPNTVMLRGILTGASEGLSRARFIICLREAQPQYVEGSV